MTLFLTIVVLFLLAVIALIVHYHRLTVGDILDALNNAKLELIGRDEIIENYEQDFLTQNENIEELQSIRKTLHEQCVEHEEEISRLETEIAHMVDISAIKEQTLEAKEGTIDLLHKALDRADNTKRDLEETVTFHVNNCMPHLTEIRKRKFPTAG